MPFHITGILWIDIFIASPIVLLDQAYSLWQRNLLFPIDLIPGYSCNGLGGFHCVDQSNSGLWYIVLSIILLFVFSKLIRRFIKVPKNNILFLLTLLYIGIAAGIILFYLVDKYSSPKNNEEWDEYIRIHNPNGAN